MISTKKFIGLSLLSGVVLLSGCSSDSDGLLLNSRVDDGMVILGSDPVIDDDTLREQKEVTIVTRENILKPSVDTSSTASSDSSSVSQPDNKSYQLDAPYQSLNNLNNQQSNASTISTISTTSTIAQDGFDETDSSSFKANLRERLAKINKYLLNRLNFDKQNNIKDTRPICIRRAA